VLQDVHHQARVREVVDQSRSDVVGAVHNQQRRRAVALLHAELGIARAPALQHFHDTKCLLQQTPGLKTQTQTVLQLQYDLQHSGHDRKVRATVAVR
jgi:hypothetical protein